jgi:hypothetical protein
MEDFSQWIPYIMFAITILGMAIKYGADQQRQKSVNEMQDREIDRLKEDFKAEKEHNAGQHREFYDVAKQTIGIQSDIKHMMGAIDQIKLMLERRGAPRD